jgi:ATP-dependent exoDNAse (exonuclease V) alpha subunit
VSVNLTQARSYSVHESRDIDVAVGDKLLLMSNWKEDGFRATNGELLTVRSVERGNIGLEDGRSLPSNYREFTHGYAVTAHRSQGKTVDKVIISADVMKQELFYVAASRGREDIAIVTSDANRLGESLGVSMARPSAIELASQIAQSVQAPEQDMAQASGPSMQPSTPKFEISPEHGFGLSL